MERRGSIWRISASSARTLSMEWQPYTQKSSRAKRKQLKKITDNQPHNTDLKLDLKIFNVVSCIFVGINFRGFNEITY